MNPAINGAASVALVLFASPAYLFSSPISALGQAAEERLSTSPWGGGIQHTFRVSSVADTGPGTLREAILRANASPGADRIIFTSDADLYTEPRTISLESPLPAIAGNLFIDGFITNMLWKASGITLSGNNQYRLFEVEEYASLVIEHLTIADGRAEQGGGVLNNGIVLAKGVTFLGNSVTGKGGAIYNRGTLHLINSTLAKNQAGGAGGALYNEDGRLVITNATFAWNGAESGGGLYNQGKIQMSNTILAGSEGTVDCVSTVAFDAPLNRNIVQSEQGCGTSFSSDDPLLGSLGFYNGPTKTIPIAGNSPAVNWGSNAAALDFTGVALIWDQRGNGDPRFAAGITDIGAFESQQRMHLEVDTPEDSEKRWCTSFANDCSLTGALQIAARSEKLSYITFDPGIFAGPTTLTISESLPEFEGVITVDASNVPTITVDITTAAGQVSSTVEKLLLKNVVIRTGP